MTNQKNALLLFTKAPETGKTKTRLTTARGGIFTPEEAADFYKVMLLDVVEICFTALKELNCKESTSINCSAQYDFVISCPSIEDQRKLEELFAQMIPDSASIIFINDHGRHFNEHFDDAFGQLFDLSYKSVVAIGGDLPTLPVSHIVQAFQWLERFDLLSDRGGFVQAPCQACGVSLVGYTAATPMDSKGVYYNPDGIPALDGYIAKAAEKDIPVATLEQVPDVDDTSDLAHTISLLRAMAYSSKYQPGLFMAKRTLQWIDESMIMVCTPPNTAYDPRDSIDSGTRGAII